MNDVDWRTIGVRILLAIVGFAGDCQGSEGDQKGGLEKSHSDQLWRF